MSKTVTLQFQGLPVKISYNVLPNNLCLWNLVRPAEMSNVPCAPELYTLSESLLRQFYGEQIQRDLLEYVFYDEMAQTASYDQDDEDIPF